MQWVFSPYKVAIDGEHWGRIFEKHASFWQALFGKDLSLLDDSSVESFLTCGFDILQLGIHLLGELKHPIPHSPSVMV